MQEVFRAFVPIDIIEKGKKDENGLPEELIISGIASTPKMGYDKQGQMLDMNGFDLSPLLEKGFINLEHAYAKTKDATMIVGEPTNAFVKDGDLHLEGRLYKDNPKAVAVYKLAQTLKKSGSKRKIGYSIEGDAHAYDPRNKRIVSKGAIKHVAITISPICNGTEMIVKGGDSPFEYELQEGSDFVVDLTDGNERYTVDKDLNVNIEKAMTAGEGTGRDTADKPSNGDALKEESLDGKKKKKKVEDQKEELTKADVYYDLISKYDLDLESCEMVFKLSLEIDKFSATGK